MAALGGCAFDEVKELLALAVLAYGWVTILRLA
jgi:hypothetical protein